MRATRPSGGFDEGGRRRKYTALLKGANFREAARWPGDPFQNFSRVSQSHHPGAAAAARLLVDFPQCKVAQLYLMDEFYWGTFKIELIS